jgi:putative transposase
MRQPALAAREKSILTKSHAPARQRWARLRFLVVGQLLVAPPKPGDLRAQLEALAARDWVHPTSGEPVKFGLSTIARWYYAARNEPLDPVARLERKTHALAGKHPAVSELVRAAMRIQHREHPAWSFKLHHDNLLALAKSRPELLPLPSYPTLRRWMQSDGLPRKRKKRQRPEGEGFVPREQRSFEVSNVHALWHLDFHQCSRSVLLPTGEWKKPVLLGVLDDCSRLCCHLQWFLEETAEALVHAFSQAIQKRGLPRMLLTDNGAPMLAAETRQGLERLGITHVTTLPYSPEQNAKQEVFWAQIEGRLMAMLEGEPELSLGLLNRATVAWAELEYQRKLHSELGCSPLERMLKGPSVARPSPDSDALRRAFRMTVKRTQRRSDGTISVEGKRFELPSRFRTLGEPTVRYARWDLSTLDLVDPFSGKLLCLLFPLDKQANAAARRRPLEPVAEVAADPAPSGIAPLLKSLLAEHAATGLPSAYVPLVRQRDLTSAAPAQDDQDHQDFDEKELF